MLKRLGLAAFVCAAISTAALGQTSASATQPSPPTAQASQPHLVESGSYTNSAGMRVHSPAHTDTGAAPAGASAQCRDGSYSFSMSHRGTCSHHGGVARWL